MPRTSPARPIANPEKNKRAKDFESSYKRAKEEKPNRAPQRVSFATETVEGEEVVVPHEKETLRLLDACLYHLAVAAKDFEEVLRKVPEDPSWWQTVTQWWKGDETASHQTLEEEKEDITAALAQENITLRKEVSRLPKEIQEYYLVVNALSREKRKDSITSLKKQKKRIESIIKQKEAELPEGQRLAFLSAERMLSILSTRRQNGHKERANKGGTDKDFFTRLELYALELDKHSERLYELLYSFRSNQADELEDMGIDIDKFHSVYGRKNLTRLGEQFRRSRHGIYLSIRNIVEITHSMESGERRTQKNLDNLYKSVSQVVVQIEEILESFCPPELWEASPDKASSVEPDLPQSPEVKGILKKERPAIVQPEEAPRLEVLLAPLRFTTTKLEVPHNTGNPLEISHVLSYVETTPHFQHKRPQQKEVAIL